jgi:hypothetical protein
MNISENAALQDPAFCQFSTLYWSAILPETAAHTWFDTLFVDQLGYVAPFAGALERMIVEPPADPWISRSNLWNFPCIAWAAGDRLTLKAELSEAIYKIKLFINSIDSDFSAEIGATPGLTKVIMYCRLVRPWPISGTCQSELLNP